MGDIAESGAQIARIRNDRAVSNLADAILHELLSGKTVNHFNLVASQATTEQPIPAGSGDVEKPGVFARELALSYRRWRRSVRPVDGTLKRWLRDEALVPAPTSVATRTR